MTEPEWLDEAIVLRLHAEQLSEFGGLAGIRDFGLLSSALARPKNVWHFSQPKPDIVRLAASYAFGIAKNHPFADGNKRSSLIACHLFLRQNGFDLVAPQADQIKIILDLAAGSVTEEQLEAWLREHVEQRDAARE
jgi:death-on-curing protein